MDGYGFRGFSEVVDIVFIKGEETEEEEDLFTTTTLAVVFSVAFGILCLCSCLLISGIFLCFKNKKEKTSSETPQPVASQQPTFQMDRSETVDFHPQDGTVQRQRS